MTDDFIFLLLLLFSPAMSRVEEQPMTFCNTPYACLALRGIFRTWMGPPNRGTFRRRAEEGHRVPSTSGYCTEFKEGGDHYPLTEITTWHGKHDFSSRVDGTFCVYGLGLC